MKLSRRNFFKTLAGLGATAVFPKTVQAEEQVPEVENVEELVSYDSSDDVFAEPQLEIDYGSINQRHYDKNSNSKSRCWHFGVARVYLNQEYIGYACGFVDERDNLYGNRYIKMGLYRQGDTIAIERNFTRNCEISIKYSKECFNYTGYIASYSYESNIGSIGNRLEVEFLVGEDSKNRHPNPS